MSHINPFAKMNKKSLKASLEVDIDSRFNAKKILEKKPSIDNFLHLQPNKKVSA